MFLGKDGDHLTESRIPVNNKPLVLPTLQQVKLERSGREDTSDHPSASEGGAADTRVADLTLARSNVKKKQSFVA